MMAISKKSRDLNDTLVFLERFYAAPHSRNVSWLGLNWFRIYERGEGFRPLPGYLILKTSRLVKFNLHVSR